MTLAPNAADKIKPPKSVKASVEMVKLVITPFSLWFAKGVLRPLNQSSMTGILFKFGFSEHCPVNLRNRFCFNCSILNCNLGDWISSCSSG